MNVDACSLYEQLAAVPGLARRFVGKPLWKEMSNLPNG
jgi:hypothetical protein